MVLTRLLRPVLSSIRAAPVHHQTTRAIFFNMGNSGSASPADTQLVQDLINDNCVVVFSKTTCGFCRMAKKTLDATGVDYKVVELNQIQGGSGIQDSLAQMTGASTVPRVFINGKCIGGGTETRQLHQEGKLLPLIQECGLSS